MNKVTIYFAQNQKAPLAGQMRKLDPFVSDLASPGSSVCIFGHAATEGTAAQNLKLSTDRAQCVRTYLVGKGANTAQVKISACGNSQPVVREQGEGPALEAQRAKNRRVEVEIEAGPKMQAYYRLLFEFDKRYQNAVSRLRNYKGWLRGVEQAVKKSPTEVPALLEYWQDEGAAVDKDVQGYETGLDLLENASKQKDGHEIRKQVGMYLSLCDYGMRRQRERITLATKRMAEAQSASQKARDANWKKFWDEMVQDYKEVTKERAEELKNLTSEKTRWLEALREVP